MRERERPASAIPLPLLFVPIFLGVFLLHTTLLRLPYFWDEGGYYIPAAWDFFRLGTLIPQSTMTNAHPPLPSVLMAAWWKLTGFYVYSTRLLICVVASFALLGIFRWARLLAGTAVAATVLVLTAIYPVWFAQSTLAHADIFAAAFTLWALSFHFDRPGWRLQLQVEQEGRKPLKSHAPPGKAGVPHSFAAPSRKGGFPADALTIGTLFSLAVLSKETAIVTPAALFLYELFLVVKTRRRHTHVSEARHGAPIVLRSSTAYLAALAFPVLPLVGWYAYHRAKTGFIFGNPEFLRYNATANLSAARVLLSLWHRLIHLTVHMNLFVPVLLTCAVLLLPRDRTKPALARGAVEAIATILIANWIAFSILGGALLTRYLLPMFPLVLLLCVALWRERVKAWPAFAALSLAGFAAGCEINPPYPFAPEDNLAYRDMVVLQQTAIHILQARESGATVLTAWPVAADLQRPELGYLKSPMKTTEIANFTREEVAKAAQEPGAYDAALVFSTKYNPPAGGLNLAAGHMESDSKYFDAHRDLLPDEVARALGGHVLWQADRNGQWAAVLRFDRSYDAKLKRLR